MTSNRTTVTGALEELHLRYVEAVNHAVAEDRMDLVATLAAEYDREALPLLLQQDLHAA